MNKRKNKKEFRSNFILLLVITLIFFSCTKDEETPNDTQNDENSLLCEIISPDNGTEVPQGTNLSISANVIDSIYLLDNVKFYQDSLELASIYSEPYRYELNTTYLDTGTYIIKAVAENSIGLTEIDEIFIKIVFFDSDFGTEGSGVIDIDGNQYKTVIIGQQEWMAENLKVTHYPDGTEIPKITGDNNWKNLDNNNGAYCWFQDNSYNKNIYGALYTWSAAMNNSESTSNNPSDVQGVCPDGWHLPSESEWNELFDELGGYNEARGKMKEIGTFHWNNPNIGATNESGFWALPGGYRSSIFGSCMSLGNTGYWWSSTLNTYFYLTNDNNTEIYLSGESSYGFSVRCVKD